MKTLNARVAIYCDVEVEVPDDFDYYDSYDTDSLMDRVFENTPEPYDSKAGRVVEACGYEILSIWDEKDDVCLYTD